MARPVLLRTVAALLVVAALGGGCIRSGESSGAERRRGDLQGTFRLAAGRCIGDGPATGSWMRVTAGGAAGERRPLPNPDSACGDHTFTPLRPGRDGGLRTSGYQPTPEPAFDDAGNSRADRIIEPVRWRGSTLGLSTNPEDLQAKAAVPPPRLRAEGRVLTGDLRAVAATWAGSFLNVGVPKPDGSRPPGTAGPQGALDRATGSFTIEWTSLVVGGELSNATVTWHLEGRFAAS